ncbi:cadherin domain-containing protein [Marinicrinis sediminis]|uniref:Cadherin domain-containing protein n=1 Tax=Marinicrinis sediminis TaxID=1652465 RepID=A0ABW5RER2_9BACL
MLMRRFKLFFLSFLITAITLSVFPVPPSYAADGTELFETQPADFSRLSFSTTISGAIFDFTAVVVQGVDGFQYFESMGDGDSKAIFVQGIDSDYVTIKRRTNEDFMFKSIFLHTNDSNNADDTFVKGYLDGVEVASEEIENPNFTMRRISFGNPNGTLVDEIRIFALNDNVNAQSLFSVIFDTLVVNVSTNAAPTASGFSVAIDENTANGTTVGTVTGNDADGDSLSYSISSGNTGSAFAINSSTGVITVNDSTQLDYETGSTSYTLDIVVSDGTQSTNATASITINNVNDNSPTATGFTVGIDEDTANGTTVGTITGSDGDGDALTYTITSGNTGSAFAINSSTGVITVNDSTQLDYETSPTSYTLNIEVSDGSLTANAVATINVNNVNESPTATGFTVGINENTANGTTVGTITGSDGDGDALTYTITSGNTGSAFAINSSTGVITVNDSSQLDYEAGPMSYTLNIEVSDGSLTANAVATINVNNVNDNTPTATGFTVGIDENTTDGTTVGTVTGNDADGNALSYSISSGNTGSAFAINSSTGVITVNDSSQLDYEAGPTSYTLNVEVSDGSLTGNAVATINVNNVNESPEATGFTVGVDENTADGTTVGTVTGNDVEGDALTYSISSGNTGNAFTINSTTGEVTVNDSTQLDYEAGPTSYTLNIEVSDGSLTANAVATINVNNVNESPTATGFTVGVNENAANGTTVGTVVGNDAEGDTLTYSISSGNTGTVFAINSSTGVITVNDSSQLDYEAGPTSYSLNIEVSDGSSTANATATINVNNINESPTATGFTVGINENTTNGTTVGTITGNDADGDALTYSITSGNTGSAFAINSSTGEVTVNDSSQLDYEAGPTSYTLNVEVSDGSLTANAVATINVNNVNDNTPTATGFTVGVDENTANGTTVGTVTGNDADGDALTYSITSGNTGNAFAINSSTGEVTVNDSSQLDYETGPTSYTLNVEVNDGSLTANAVATITLNNVNDNTPTATGFTVAIDENTTDGTNVGTVTGNDADGDALTYSITSGNTGSAFAINSSTGEVTVNDSSQLDYEAGPTSYTLNVEVSDGQDIAMTDIEITLNNLNDTRPVATPKSINTSIETSVNGMLEAMDPDGDDVTFIVQSQGAKGNLTFTDASTGSFTYEPSLDQLGTDSVAIQVSDGTFMSDVVNLTIEIHPSDNADLETLSISSGNLSPYFDSDETEYEVTVENEISQFTLTPSVSERHASVLINGSSVESGSPYSHTDLQVGQNSFSILVEAQSGITKIYNVNVNRKASNDANLTELLISKGRIVPDFDPDKLKYQVNLSYGIKSVSLIPTSSHANAVIRINGELQTSATESSDIDLEVGPNIVEIEVTAEDGITTKLYELNIRRHKEVVESVGNPDVRTVIVTVEGDDGSLTMSVPIKRLLVNGAERDEVIFDKAKAREIVEKASESAKDTVRIIIDDLPQNLADEYYVKLPLDALKLLDENELQLQVDTPNASIRLTKETVERISGKGKDLYFLLIPIRDEEEFQAVSDRTSQAEQVREFAKNKDVQVVGQPMKIETNYEDAQTGLFLPLTERDLPADPELWAAYAAGLAVYIEHSDGEKVVQTGTVQYDQNGKPVGILIMIDKFSTFTIIAAPQQVDTVIFESYISGYPNGSFQPNRGLTRAELAAVLARNLDRAYPDKDLYFEDVSVKHWAYQAIEQVFSAGLMVGDQDGGFRPDEVVKRSELAVIAKQWGKLSHFDQSLSYSDLLKSHWAWSAIAAVTEEGWMKGYEDNSFRSDQAVTRAEAVKVINRMLNRPLISSSDVKWIDVSQGYWAYMDIISASSTYEMEQLNDGSWKLIQILD